MFLSYFCKPKAVVVGRGENVSCGALRSIPLSYLCLRRCGRERSGADATSPFSRSRFLNTNPTERQDWENSGKALRPSSPGWWSHSPFWFSVLLSFICPQISSKQEDEGFGMVILHHRWPDVFLHVFICITLTSVCTGYSPSSHNFTVE